MTRMSERLPTNEPESLSLKALHDFIVTGDEVAGVDFETFADLCATVAEERGLSPEDMDGLIRSIRAAHAQGDQS